MLKFSLRIFVVTLTFFFGLSITAIFQFYTETLVQVKLFDEKIVNSPIIPLSTNLCQIIENPEIYDGKLVTFEANAFVVDDKVLLDAFVRCQLKEETYLRQSKRFLLHLDNETIYQTLELSQYNGKNRNLKNLLELFQPVEIRAEVDVKIVGIPRKFINKYGDLDFYIIPADIEFVSPFREFIGRGSS